ncbi:MAG: RsmE family RNA methyltransferase [Deltaproteobacteria bacterium]|nr:RsmE family RNA methyltransferase [Deltaproteobacteria bacterium]
MNCLIIREEEVLSSGEACLTGLRRQHVLSAHELAPQLTVRAALLGGKRGSATVLSISDSEVRLALSLHEAPLERNPISWIVAVARPQTTKKVIQLAATLGVSELHLIRTSQVVKSYLQSLVLEPANIEAEILKGLEQSGDSIAPRVHLHKFFRPFMEDVLPALRSAGSGAQGMIADTRAPRSERMSLPKARSVLLAIGPEAGWSESEVTQFCSQGFAAISLGERFLRVDAACIYATAAIDALRA